MRLLEQILLRGLVSMSNLHCIITIDNVDRAPVLTLWPLLENHDDFPGKINIGFMQMLHRRQICLRVYERVTGET